MSSKISDLSDGGAIQSTDQFVVARSGANYKITGGNVGSATGGVGAMTLIEDNLLAADAASFDFTNIPGTYKHLYLVMQLRGTKSATSAQPRVTFNGDTGTNYEVQKHYAAGGTPASVGTTGTTYIDLTDATAASSASGAASAIECVIPNYAGTSFHKSLSSTGFNPRSYASGSEYVMNTGGAWKNTAAITRVTITPDSNNWASGSRATLYGVGGNNQVNGALSFSGCKATRSTDMSISATTSTAITWDTEEYDTDGYHSTSSNTSRLTVPAVGKYRVTGNLRFAAGEAGFVTLRKNGDTSGGILAQSAIAPATQATDAFNAASLAVEVALAANDYVELVVFTNTASDVKAGGSGYGQASLSIQRLDSTPVNTSFSGARVYNNANISLADSTVTPVTFNSERFDTDGYHDTGSNTNRLTIPATGYYLIGCGIEYAANGTGDRIVTIRDSSGTSVASESAGAATASQNTRLSPSTLIYATAGEWFEVAPFQSSGGALNILATGNRSPEFWIARYNPVAQSGAVSDNLARSVVQASHGLAVGDVVRHNGTSYVKAQADSAANAEAIGIVSAVVDANNFTLTSSGLVAGLTGLTAGAVYFLSASTAGALTATEPSTIGQVSKPLLWSMSTTTGVFVNQRGAVIGTNGQTRSVAVELLNPQVAANAGNAFFSVLGLTDWDAGHWEFVKDVDGKVYGIVRVPPTYVSGGTLRLAIAANATSGVTRLVVGTKAVADGESLNPTLTDETAQDITVPGTAYLRRDVTFALTETLAANDLLIIEIYHAGAHANDTLAVNTLLLGVWLEVTAT